MGIGVAGGAKSRTHLVGRGNGIPKEREVIIYYNG